MCSLRAWKVGLIWNFGLAIPLMATFAHSPVKKLHTFQPRIRLVLLLVVENGGEDNRLERIIRELCGVVMCWAWIPSAKAASAWKWGEAGWVGGRRGHAGSDHFCRRWELLPDFLLSLWRTSICAEILSVPESSNVIGCHSSVGKELNLVGGEQHKGTI